MVQKIIFLWIFHGGICKRYLLSEDDDHAVNIPIWDLKIILSLALYKILVWPR